MNELIQEVNIVVSHIYNKYNFSFMPPFVRLCQRKTHSSNKQTSNEREKENMHFIFIILLVR